MPVNLSHLFNGEVKVIRFDGAATLKGPADGKAWLTLYGTVYHVTGTNTTVVIYSSRGSSAAELANARTLFVFHRAAAIASYINNLFNNEVSLADGTIKQPASMGLIFVTPNMTVHHAGAATSYTELTVLEFPYGS